MHDPYLYDPNSPLSPQAGGGQLTGGLTSAMSSIPVWGQIAAAAAMGKRLTAGMHSPIGNAANALLLPSIEEWYAQPMASFGNTIDPFGTAAFKAGLPKEASLALGPGALFR